MTSRRPAHQPNRGAAPRYRRIEAILRDQISSGELNAGDRVPTEEKLVVDFKVSRPTVRRALQILEQENLIVRNAGRGTFVNAIAEDLPARRQAIALDDLVDFERPPKIVIQREGTLAARGLVQSALGLPFGTEVYYFIRLFYRDSTLFGGTKIYLPRVLGRHLTKKDKLAGRFLDALAIRCGRPPVDVDFKVEAILADARTGDIFQTTVGAPLISIRRVSYDAQGHALEHSHILFRSDLCQISFRRRRGRTSGKGNSA